MDGLFGQEGPVAHVTINREPALNALNERCGGGNGIVRAEKGAPVFDGT